jgi:hypothetical protein
VKDFVGAARATKEAICKNLTITLTNECPLYENDYINNPKRQLS